MKNHNFEPGDTVVLVAAHYSNLLTLGKKYLVLESGFWSIKVMNDLGVAQWVNAHSFEHVPRVTIVKGHLKRIVFGK